MTLLQFITQGTTFALALYGAGLATYSAMQARKRDRRSIKVRLTTMMYTYGPNLGPPMVSIEVVNDGHRAMVVDVPQLMVASDPGRVIAFTDADGIKHFPAKLGEGETSAIRVEYREVATALLRGGHTAKVKLLAVCKDSTGQVYRSAPWDVDVQEWLRMAA